MPEKHSLQNSIHRSMTCNYFIQKYRDSIYTEPQLQAKIIVQLYNLCTSSNPIIKCTSYRNAFSQDDIQEILSKKYRDGDCTAGGRTCSHSLGEVKQTISQLLPITI